MLCRRRNFGHVRPRSYKIQYIPGQQQTFPVPANHSPKLLIFGSIWNVAIIPFSTSKFQAERLQIWRKVINKSKGQFLQVAHLPTLRPSHPSKNPNLNKSYVLRLLQTWVQLLSPGDICKYASVTTFLTPAKLTLQGNLPHQSSKSGCRCDMGTYHIVPEWRRTVPET